MVREGFDSGGFGGGGGGSSGPKEKDEEEDFPDFFVRRGGTPDMGNNQTSQPPPSQTPPSFSPTRNEDNVPIDPPGAGADAPPLRDDFDQPPDPGAPGSDSSTLGGQMPENGIIDPTSAPIATSDTSQSTGQTGTAPSSTNTAGDPTTGNGEGGNMTMLERDILDERSWLDKEDVAVEFTSDGAVARFTETGAEAQFAHDNPRFDESDVDAVLNDSGEWEIELTDKGVEENIRHLTPRANQSRSLGTTGTPGLAAGPRSRNIRERTPRASQSQSLGTTGTPGLAAGPRSRAAREARQEQEGIADSDRRLFGAELKARAEARVETETGRQADVTLSTRREEDRLVADVVDVDLGEPTGDDIVEDPSAGPIAEAARRATGDPLGGFRASLFDNRQTVEEHRVDAVEGLESSTGIDFSEVVPGTPASRKEKIDSFVGEQAKKAATPATILPQLGLALAREGADTVGDEVGVDLGEQAREEAEKIGAVATILPRTAASAGAEFAKDSGVNSKEALAAAAVVGVAAPEPVTTATGLAVLGGLGAAAAVGFATESELSVGDPAETFSELGVGGQTQVVEELGVGGQSLEESEIEVGGETRRVTELDIPTGEAADPTTLHAAELVGLQKQREIQKPIISEEDIAPDLPDPDQPPPSVREQIRRDDLFAPAREFPTGESAVVGRETAQDAAEEMAQEEAAREEALPAEEQLAGSDEALVPGVDERADTALDTAVTPVEMVDQVPDVAQDFPTQPTVKTPEFGTPTGIGTPTRVLDPTLTGPPPNPPVTPPVELPPDIGFGGDKKKRRKQDFGEFEKTFEANVASAEDVLSGDGTDDVFKQDVGALDDLGL